MAATSLPPGFRFHPTDVELIKYYLKRKVLGKKLASDVIAEVDIYKNEPWDLPDKSYLKGRDLKWYFFCPRERKYANGGRMNRATECGYWKTTGKDRAVLHNSKTVGMIKTLVFHKGRAPKGDRTDWVMHEYRLDDKDLADGVVQDAFVLCIVFQKDGPGPRNGAQYGAPFKEDDWSDDEEVSCVGHALSAAAQPVPAPSLPSIENISEGFEIMCTSYDDLPLSDLVWEDLGPAEDDLSLSDLGGHALSAAQPVPAPFLHSNKNSSEGSEILCTPYDEGLSWSDLVWKDLESTEDGLSLSDLGGHALSASQPVPATFLHSNENSSKGSEMLCTSYDEGLSLSDIVWEDLEPTEDGISLSDLVRDDQVQGDDDLLSMMDSFWEDSPGVYLFHPEV